MAINEAVFFYPSDLVNAKTTIPLRVDEEQWIYTLTLHLSVYIHHYSPLLQGIVDGSSCSIKSNANQPSHILDNDVSLETQ